MAKCVFRIVLCIACVCLAFAPFSMAACPQGDLDGNCRVNLDDLGIMASHWLDEAAPFLRAVHLNGNHGGEDEHLAFTKGGLTWGGFFSKIRELQDSCELVIEVMREEDYSESVHALKKLGITGRTQTKPLEEKTCEKR